MIPHRHGAIPALTVILMTWSGPAWLPAQTTQRAATTPDLHILPRLTPQADDNSRKLSLNGTWRFHTDPPAPFWSPELPSREGWADIHVPGEWVMQGFTVAANKAAVYRRTISIPLSWQGQRVLFRCDAVYTDATVYINGREMGHHVGGFTPFELDATDAIRPGQDNLIVIAVKAESVADLLSHGSKYAFHSLGGILRKTCLFAVPAVHVASLCVRTRMADNDDNDVAQILVDVANAGDRDGRDLTLRCTLSDYLRPDSVLQTATITLPTIPAGAAGSHSVRLPVRKPKRWDCEHPNLYRIALELRSGEQVLETVQQRFGFRQIEVRGNQLFINNHPVKLRGVNRHEVHPLLGRSLTPELCRKDAELFRDANINYIRTSHYPPSEEFLEACDELGLFVGEEAPFCFVGMTWGNKLWETENPHDPKYRRDILRPTLEMIARDRNHPSVIVWSLANESLWGPAFVESAQVVEKADPTRPRTFSFLPWEVSLNKEDEPYCQIGADHYPNEKGPAKYADHHRPIAFDEYCHINAYEKEEINADPGVREEWVRPFHRMWENIYAAPGVLGGSIWAGISDWFLIPNSKPTGCGDWGPIDGWRRTLPEHWNVKKVYSPVHITQPQLPVPPAGESLCVEVENRHDFTNLNELRIEWSLNGQTGTAQSDIKPRSCGILPIPMPGGDLHGSTLHLKFHSPRGFLIDEYQLPIGEIAAPAESPALASRGTSPPQLVETETAFTVHGGTFEWQIDRKTGQVVYGKLNHRIVVNGGPTLMMLPLACDEANKAAYVESGLLNKTCSDWKLESLSTHIVADEVSVQAVGSYKEAKGGYTLRFDSAGNITLYYFFKPEITMNPRQIGMVLSLPREFDSLRWDRKARWNVYPPDHIGRPTGTARAERDATWPKIDARTAPPWPWSLDSNELGTIDFRSTRTDIRWASLSAPDGAGLRVCSDGSQSTRCWLAGKQVKMLIAEFSRGSGEPYMNRWGRLFQEDQRPVLKESALEDVIHLKLIAAKP